jgi:hypothetical protein
VSDVQQMFQGPELRGPDCLYSKLDSRSVPVIQRHGPDSSLHQLVAVVLKPPDLWRNTRYSSSHVRHPKARYRSDQ